MESPLDIFVPASYLLSRALYRDKKGFKREHMDVFEIESALPELTLPARNGVCIANCKETALYLATWRAEPYLEVRGITSRPTDRD